MKKVYLETWVVRLIMTSETGKVEKYLTKNGQWRGQVGGVLWGHQSTKPRPPNGQLLELALLGWGWGYSMFLSFSLEQL